jgi:hypothetical protein
MENKNMASTEQGIASFFNSEGFKSLVARQQQGIRFGLNCKTAQPGLRIDEVDCSSVYSKGGVIAPGFAVSSDGRPIANLVGTDDLASILFSMVGDTNTRLRNLETDEFIIKTSGTWEIRDRRIAERDLRRQQLSSALQDVQTVIDGIANGTYSFARREVRESNHYQR